MNDFPVLSGSGYPRHVLSSVAEGILKARKLAVELARQQGPKRKVVLSRTFMAFGIT